MLQFTLKMMFTDLRTAFHGFWILGYFGLLCCFIFFLFSLDNPYSFLYLAVMVLSYLIPQFPKLFYVLPFDDAEVRKYLHLRGIFSALLLLLIGGMITLLSLWLPIDHTIQGWQILLLFVQICLVMSLVHIKAIQRRKTLKISLLILLFAGNLVNIIINKRIELMFFISLLLLLATDLYVVIALKSFHLKNYTEPVYGYLFNNKRMRQEIQSGGKSL